MRYNVYLRVTGGWIVPVEADDIEHAKKKALDNWFGHPIFDEDGEEVVVVKGVEREGFGESQ